MDKQGNKVSLQDALEDFFKRIVEQVNQES